jgi:hypothetical protein
VAEVLRKADLDDTLELFRAAGHASLRHEPAGLRFLFTFLEVKRPGVEVLEMLEPLASLERVALRLAGGSWREPDETQAADPSLPILEVLEEARRAGMLDLRIDELPSHHSALRALFAHLRRWFGNMRALLAHGDKPAESSLHLLTHLAMVETGLLERRVSRLASIIDPYDVRALGRLMPLLSRYDQDIEHIKSVVSRITTYKPFQERALSMEQVLPSRELGKVAKGLIADPATRGMARILAETQRNPMLSHAFGAQVSALHRLTLLRAREVEDKTPPDLHSTMLLVLLHAGPDASLRVAMESEILAKLEPAVRSWGGTRSDGLVELRYREAKVLEFLETDGTPRLPDRPDEPPPPRLSIKEMVRSQLQSEAFLLGVLKNPKATQIPGLVALVAAGTRSLRVLDVICRDKNLHSGPINRDVPPLLLANPSRIPINYLRRFIHVRFTSRTELRGLLRAKGGVRPEVHKEVEQYLRTLKS